MTALDRAVRDSQRRRRLVDAALMTGVTKPWDYQPFRDATKQYMRNTMDLDDLEAMARFPRVTQGGSRSRNLATLVPAHAGIPRNDVRPKADLSG